MNAKETLNKIRQKYACKGDIIFRAAIQNVVEVGQCTILDPCWYECTLEDIHAKHENAEKEGKWLFMTRDFEVAILECMKELADINPYDLLTYIQKEVWLGGEVGEIDYQEAIKLLKDCVNHIENSEYNIGDTLDVLYNIGFDDDQIEYLGFGHLLDVEE